MSVNAHGQDGVGGLAVSFYNSDMHYKTLGGALQKDEANKKAEKKWPTHLMKHFKRPLKFVSTAVNQDRYPNSSS